MKIKLIKVFIVDDEANNLFLFEEYLSLFEQFHTTTFQDPREALKALRENEEKPDVVISDEDMPAVKGTELIKVVAQIVPQAMRVIVTGKMDVADLEKSQKENTEHAPHFFIGKPYDMDTIIKRILQYFDPSGI